MTTKKPTMKFKKGDKVVSKRTGAMGTVSGTGPFAVKFNLKGRKFNRFSNQKFWKRK